MVAFAPLTREDLSTVSPWFDDPDTRRWLGGREWPERLLRLVSDPPREQRGSQVRQRAGLLVLEAGEPIGLVDAEIYADRTAAIAFVIAPQHRHCGLGTATLVALSTYLSARGVDAIVGGVERGNVASQRCVTRAGFSPVTGAVDEENFVDYVLRCTPTEPATRAAAPCGGPRRAARRT